MDWSPEIEELNQIQRLAKKMGGAKSIEKQHSLGKLTVRERMDLLLDPDSFREIGTIAGNAEFDNSGNIQSFTPAETVGGFGAIDSRLVCVNGDDWTVPGTGGRAGGGKGAFIEKTASDWGVPLIRLLDSSGTRVGTLEQQGYSSIPDFPALETTINLMAEVPVISAVLGPAAGWVAIMATLSHWSIMTKKTAQLFVAGPPLVERALGVKVSKEDLGGYKVHAHYSGVVDNVADTEEDLFHQIRAFLSYLPQNVWHQPPRVTPDDDPNRRDNELLTIVPKDTKKSFDMKKLISHIVDKNSLFELSPFYGKSLLTFLARVDGYPVAVMGNSSWIGGAQDTAACEKMMRFIDLANTFHLPVVNFVDIPGFMIGPDAERTGTLRKAARAMVAMGQSTTPWIGILVRRCYGVAGWAHRRPTGVAFRYAWPSAQWGSLPVAGGAMAAYRSDIEAASDPQAKEAEIERHLKQLSSPERTAFAFGVEEIIDPRDTRPYLCQLVKQSQHITSKQLGPKGYSIRP